MGGTSYFPIKVEIAFGCDPMDPSPTWTDVSEHVLRSRTISCSRGSGESGEVDPGRGQIILANDSGDFTPGHTGAFGLVRNRLPVRISAVMGSASGGTYDSPVWYDAHGVTYDAATLVEVPLWTGLVEKLSMGFDNGVRPIVTGTLIDRWARLKARTLTGDRILQACQTLAPAFLWPLTDQAGSTRAEAAIGARDLLVVDALLPPTFGSAENPQGATQMKAASCPSVTDLTIDQPNLPGLLLTGAATLSLWCAPTTIGSATIRLGSFAGAFMRVMCDRSGGAVIVGTDGTSASSVPATLAGWHHIATTFDGGVLRLYVDGVETASTVWAPGSWTPELGVWVQGTDNTAVAYAALWDRALPAAAVAVIAAAGLDALGQAGQTADVRAALAAAMWQPTTITTQGTFTSTMSKQAVDGVSQADLLQQCATTEGGTLHIGSGGWPVLQSRGYRTGSPVVTIPASVLSADTQWELDDTTVCNVATVERMALGEAASTVTRRNDTSVASYTEVSRSVQAWLDTDVQAVERAQTEAAMWADPSPRSRTFAVDIATCQATIPQATIVAIDIGHRIVITGLPSAAPTQTAAGWYVDAIADEITATSWKRTFTVTPAIDFLVLDDATFGGLDERPLG